jgi:alpha-beta hydrolase superfamily lysophospholipase
MWRMAMALALFVGVGCGPSPVEPWHTARLTEEFTAAKADEIRTFDDYRALEDRLFAQLDREVYAHVETGPSHQLERYSAGSAADPRRRQPDWNRSFELVPETPVGGVLLLHGMSDSPYSLRALAETLARAGFRVVGLRMPGHGTAPSGLRHVRVADMTAATRLGMEHLAAQLGTRPIHIVGYSTGAALALEYALDVLEGRVSPAPASLVLVSPAVRIHAGAAMARFKDALSVLPGLGHWAFTQILPEFDPFRYNSFATNAGDVVHRLTRSVGERIARLGSRSGRELAPILVFKSAVDSTVTTEAVVDDLLARLAPGGHELVLFDLNRFAAISRLLVADPGPLTQRLMDDDTLPFAVTFVTNESPHSTAVVAFRKGPFTLEASEPVPLGLSWSPGVISLSHVALPFRPDDPLYGRRPPENADMLFLGEMALRGERGVLNVSTDWLLRMRYNPFYELLEERVLDWCARPDEGIRAEGAIEPSAAPTTYR